MSLRSTVIALVGIVTLSGCAPSQLEVKLEPVTQQINANGQRRGFLDQDGIYVCRSEKPFPKPGNEYKKDADWEFYTLPDLVFVSNSINTTFECDATGDPIRLHFRNTRTGNMRAISLSNDPQGYELFYAPNGYKKSGK